MEREKIILKVSYLSIFVNCLLFVLKLIAGLVGNSIAMISDAVHSFSDIATTFIVIIGVKIAGKESDDDHPYGHERLEAVMSVILAVILLLVGFGIAEVGFESMLNLDGSGTPPTLIALVSAVVSIVLKELMFWVKDDEHPYDIENVAFEIDYISNKHYSDYIVSIFISGFHVPSINYNCEIYELGSKIIKIVEEDLKKK